MGTKNFLEPENFFSLAAHALKANSPRLNCKDSPRTSSALALNYADSYWECNSTDKQQDSIDDVWNGLMVSIGF